MFSIVIPLYNKQNFIKRCIDSVLSQTHSEYELIIIDDGSTDHSLSIVCEYNDERIRIISQSNSGPGAARNRGVVESSKDWIAFLDADDAWTNDHLEELKLLIERFEDAGIVATKSTEIKAGRMPGGMLKDRRWKRQCVDYFRSAAAIKGFINSSTVAIKREVFGKVGYFKNMQQGEDTEFWSRVCLSYPCAVSDKPTSFYFRGTGGIMERQWSENSQQKIPNSIREIGPAVSLLVDELEGGNLSKSLRNSVIAFINSRITTVLRINLYNSQIEAMSSISEFYIHPLLPRFWFWKKLATQPRWFLIGIYGLRNFMRSLYRIFLRTLNTKMP